MAEKLNIRSIVYGSPQIYDYIKTIFIHVPKTAGTSMENILKETPQHRCGGHSTAMGVKNSKEFSEKFEKYYKFAFIRHPLNRFISSYFYLKNYGYHPSLNNQSVIDSSNINDYIENYPIENIIHFLPQYHFVCDINGNILMDDLFKFENLEKNWSILNSKIKLNLNLPIRNKTSYPDFNISLDSINTINEFYKKDFELFGYELKSNYI